MTWSVLRIASFDFEIEIGTKSADFEVGFLTVGFDVGAALVVAGF
jgi:hypothetical protein